VISKYPGAINFVYAEKRKLRANMVLKNPAFPIISLVLSVKITKL
jgi:hypothetical protein